MLRLVLAASAAIVCLANPASAKMMKATYSGVVVFGYDTGSFLEFSGRLDELKYTQVFIYDTKAGVRITTPTSDKIVSEGFFGPLVSSTITINGVTVNSGTNFSTVEISSNSLFGPHSYISGRFNEDGFDDQDMSVAEALYDGDAPPIDLEASWGRRGAFRGVSNIISYWVLSDGTEIPGYSAILAPTYVRYQPLDAVPEPSTWALSIIGFGMLGSMARRRRFSRNTAC